MEAVATTEQKLTKITKLVMDGFKSFGKRTELLFDDGFNVVLGPNGSGKSNILDALCFVLGKSSSKSLRAEKSANLIYNGGKKKNPSKQAEVSIFLDNKKKIFPVDEDTLKISRIVRHDGLSKYKINNKNSTRAQILEMLSMAKIYPDGYNIVLQGDIVRLVEMSSIDRRMIVEEIAGISVYEEKKNSALRELQKVEDKLNEAEIILKERQTYLKELKKDRDQALKYKTLGDSIKKNKASYLKRRMDKKTSEIQGVEGRNNKFKEKLQQLNDNIKSLREEIQQRKNDVKKIGEEIEEKGEVEQIKLQKELEKLQVDLATNKTKISSYQNEISRIQQRKQQLQKNLDDIDGKIKEFGEQNKELIDKKTFFEKNIAEIDKKIDDFKKKHKLGENAEIEKQLEEVDKKADEQQKELQTFKEKQQELLREKDKYEFQIQTIDEKIEKVLALEKENEVEIKALKKKKEEFKKLVLELNQLLNDDSESATKIAKLRQDMLSRQQELEKLKIKQAGIKESASANVAVKKVLENKNKLGGVFGTVSELGKTSSKYSLALEIAAAQRINSIVVEDDKTAANAINFLKKGKFGTATFVPLNKVKPVTASDEAKKLAKSPGVHGFAIDLIEFDTKFKNVFRHVFGNTLVVDSIDVARKLGVGKVRMVSLDGDLTELSGVMVGGYRHKKSGSFGEKEIGDNIKEAERVLSKAQNELGVLGRSREKNEEKINRYRELKANLEGEIIKTEKSLHLESGDLDASKSYKEELKVKIEESGKKLTEVEDAVADKTSELTQVKIQKQALRDKIAQLRNPRLLAELNAFEQKRKEFSEELIKVDTEINTNKSQGNEIFGRDKENTDKIMKEMDKEEKSFKEEIKTLEKTIKEQTKELKEKEKTQEKFMTQFKGLFSKRNRLGDEITARENKVINIEADARKQELSINSLSIEEARLKAELAGMETEFSQYDGVELDTKKTDEQLKKEIADFEKMMATIGNVNLRALEIYETVEKEYSVLVEKKESLVTEKTEVVNLMEEIEKNKTKLFMDVFDVVNNNFKQIFADLSAKGEAHLELENPEKPFDAGMRIKVRLSGNKFMDIRSLSGGEKTMTALAFLFAIQEHEPASFYIFDEVDAALDKTNSEKLAKLVKEYCKDAQYVVISHNDAVISAADTLYGVSMKPDAGLSNVVGMKV